MGRQDVRRRHLALFRTKVLAMYSADRTSNCIHHRKEVKWIHYIYIYILYIYLFIYGQIVKTSLRPNPGIMVNKGWIIIFTQIHHKKEAKMPSISKLRFHMIYTNTRLYKSRCNHGNKWRIIRPLLNDLPFFTIKKNGIPFPAMLNYSNLVIPLIGIFNMAIITIETGKGITTIHIQVSEL